MPRPPVYLDDLAAGQRFITATHVLSAEEIVAFASQFDPQPFHLDDEAARQSVFRGLAASGWHTASITMRLLVTSGVAIAGGLVGVHAELRWPAPTRPGDTLHAEVEILAVTPSRSKPDRGTVVLGVETKNQEGTVVQHFRATLVVPRRPGAAAG